MMDIVQDLDQIRYVVTEQEIIDDRQATRKGKAVVAKKGTMEIGKTGYVEWNRGAHRDRSVNTAALHLENSVWELRVERPYRKRAIGSKLLKKLFGELKKEGYDRLLINFAIGSAKGFYDKILERLKKSEEIAWFHVTERTGSALRAYDYEVGL